MISADTTIQWCFGKHYEVFLDYPEKGGCKLLRRSVCTSVPLSTKELQTDRQSEAIVTISNVKALKYDRVRCSKKQQHW
jgi:hypothetical protein